MTKLKAGQTEKKKKINRMDWEELKNKIYILKKSNDNSKYLKDLQAALKRY